MNGIVAQIQGLLKKGRVVDLILPLLISASILVIFVPLPPALMDVLLTLNIATGVIILLTSLFVTKPLDFSIFPTILLATTLFRLVLNIATTRLILTRAGDYGINAAGGVIKNFSEFVSGDSIIVGFIIFVIIIVIQFVVITKGATRVSEVAARFTLDAMPGRQMAIDADLNAGIINEQEAKRRREEIQQSADFFGAMDGAGKFVRGDAIAGIIITMVNIFGGLAIGMLEQGMDLMTALGLFTRLTIGDGLVSQVPALLISIGTGLLVTRSSYSTNLPQQFIGQMLSRPTVLILTALFLGILALTDLPRIPLFTIAASSLGLALLITKKEKKTQLIEEEKKAEEAEKAKQPEEQVEDYLKVEPMELEIGIGLVPLADPARGGDLLDRVHRLRKEIAADIGIILPRVRIRDSFRIDEAQYQIKIAGQPVAAGRVYPDMFLAMDSGVQTTGKVQGIETTDPAFGTPALWIDEATKDEAGIFGYTVVEPGAVIATHLLETVRKHADEILTRDATQHLLDELHKSSPAAVDEVVPNVLKVGQVQQVLQLLLREQVPIRQLGTILEILGDYGTKTKDPYLLTTYCRTKLARTLSTMYCDENKVLNAVMLDPALEDQIRAGFEHTEQGLYIRMSPNATDHLCKKILPEVEKLTQMTLPPVVLVNPQIRIALKQMTSAAIPNLAVLSYSEITHDTQVACVGNVTL
ncbi:MAG: flagellar biosynthesis protein FlhA [Planctomycetaceae bacterium]|jgi:flagellar biosynthesis protein FlhA|nr:flagellar biosynthesis protein FlhA [Planctomycetaceae bacterium]